MLPTPPHGDAVSVCYRPENVYLRRTCTSLDLLTRKRTSFGPLGQGAFDEFDSTELAEVRRAAEG
jgi:hypothetical protein